MIDTNARNRRKRDRKRTAKAYRLLNQFRDMVTKAAAKLPRIPRRT